jgi:hypothetical protein
MSTDEDYHSSSNISEGEISISAIMNYFALEICNSLNLVNERSRRTDIRLEKDETDTYNFQQESIRVKTNTIKLFCFVINWFIASLDLQMLA